MVATRVRSEYPAGRQPDYVAKWEKWANEAPSDMAALIQLTYVQALQLRIVKLVLVWTMVVLPIVLAIVGWVVLAQVLEQSPSFR
jgi:hypothetical protein